MKRFNLLSILILFSLLSVQYVVGQTTIDTDPQKIDGIWYSAYITNSYDIYYATSKNTESSSGNIIDKRNYTINFKYPASNLSFQAKPSKKRETQVRVKYYTNNNWSRWWTTGNINENDYGTYSSTTTIPDITSRTIEFEKNTYYLQTYTINIKNVKLQMAPHILLEDNISESYTFPETELNSTTPYYTIDFKSFLSSTTGQIEISTTNPEFKIRKKNEEATSNNVSLAGSNVFCSKDNNDYNFDIVFIPTTAGTGKSATITIKDTGSGEKIEIKVYGSAKKKTPTITWRNDEVLVYGINYAENEIATSDCGTGLTFSSSNNDVISVENGYLIINGEEGETAEIIVATTGDATWASIKDTATFTVTRKQLQTITWEQNFLLLNTESQPITLNATVNSGKTITYTIADESIATIVNGQLTVKGVVGGTTITAYVAGDDTYYEASMTKQIFVRQKTDNCNGIYAVYDPTTYSKSGWFNWDAIELSYTLATVGEYLSFEANSEGAATGQSIKITDQNGKTIYSSSNFASANNIKIGRDVKKINISAAANLSRSIKNIIVTPAIYLEPKKEQITFATIPITGTAEETIIVDWANQPDMIWATTDNEHFTVVNNAIFGGTCDNYGSTEIKIKFDPTIGGDYTGNLLIRVGENTTPVKTIPLIAKATKINHTLKWNDGIDNEIELNSIFNCNGKAIIVDNDNLHTIKYDYDTEYFTGVEEFPGYLYAKKEGKTTIVAYIEDSETCTRQEATFEVTILPEKATMTWEQDLSNFVEAESEQVVTLNATSNKEGEIVYEIVTNDDNIISLNGNQLTIKGGVIGSAEIKAYNQNYPDVFVIKNVIVASVKPCDTEVDHGVNLKTDNSIIGQDKEIVYELNLDKKCKSLSFTTDLTGDGMNGESYGIVTVSDDKRGEILNERFYDGGLVDKTCDIDPEATKITIKVKAVSVTGSLTPITATLTNVKTTLVSNFDNYTTDKDTIDFGTFTVGVSSVSEDLKINYWSLPGNINLSIESGNATRATSPFSVTPTTLSDNCGIGEKTVTITLNPNMGGTFEDYLVIKTGGDKVVEKIPLKAIINKANQTIAWTDKSLTTADRQVSIATTSSNLAMSYEIVSGGEFARVENNVLGLAAISVVDAGTFKVKAYSEGNESYYAVESEKEFTSTIGTIVFDNNKGSKDWNDAENWLPVSELNKARNVTPSAVVNAEIKAEAVISSNANNTRNEIHNILFAEGGKLTIGAGYGLEANSVEGATSDNLMLESSADGNAAFTFLSGTPSATVKIYSKAAQGDKPEWQYMGVAVDGATTRDFGGAWLLKWEEKENVTGDPWKAGNGVLAENIALVPWAGYSISQPAATTYSMKGALMNGNQTYRLTRTTREGDTQDPDCGFNLLANSYTAPIDIAKLAEENFVNADACIVLYNTGTYADWESKTGQTGEAPGQLTVVPVETGQTAGLTTTIASMQAFFVMAQEDGATFTVDYETAVAGATNHGNQMRAPKADREFNVLKIMIEGENTRDRLWLFENEETTRGYDNGYEARKIFDAPRGHQMYATCEYGYASIDCSESMVGQTIGLRGDNEGEMLTISFDTDRLDYYQSLYLYDKATGKYVNIIAGEKYTFYGIKGADDNRFSIVTNPYDEDQTPPFVVIGNALSFDKAQIDSENTNIYIYDTSGRLLMTDEINPYESYNIPDMPKGVYLVSMNGYTTKIVKK